MLRARRPRSTRSTGVPPVHTHPGEGRRDGKEFTARGAIEARARKSVKKSGRSQFASLASVALFALTILTDVRYP